MGKVQEIQDNLKKVDKEKVPLVETWVEMADFLKKWTHCKMTTL